MRIDGWTLLLQVVNFAVLVWLLHRFLYRPVTETLERRRKEVALLHDTERSVASERVGLEAAEQDIRDEAERTRAQALEEAHRQIEAERQEALSAARAERDALLEQGRRRLEEERRVALDQLQEQAVGLAASMAGALLRQLGGPSATEALLDRALTHLAGLSEPRRAELREELDDQPVVVRTWPELDEETRRRVVERVQGIVGPGSRVVFEADEALLGGAELHFPLTDVSASVRATLDEARSELERDVHA